MRKHFSCTHRATAPKFDRVPVQNLFSRCVKYFGVVLDEDRSDLNPAATNTRRTDGLEGGDKANDFSLLEALREDMEELDSPADGAGAAYLRGRSAFHRYLQWDEIRARSGLMIEEVVQLRNLPKQLFRGLSSSENISTGGVPEDDELNDDVEIEEDDDEEIEEGEDDIMEVNVWNARPDETLGDGWSSPEDSRTVDSDGLALTPQTIRALGLLIYLYLSGAKREVLGMSLTDKKSVMSPSASRLR